MKKLLIIGCTSKIARDFITAMKKDYVIYGTYNNTPPKDLDLDQVYRLDLANTRQVIKFLKTVKSVPFYGVLFFASTYTADTKDLTDYTASIKRDLSINSLSPLIICPHLTYEENAKVFLFGDAGLSQPKKGFTSYSVSKAILSEIGKILTVELANYAQVVCFKLGPTTIKTDHTNNKHHIGKEVNTINPTRGLIHYLGFLLVEKHLNITGADIRYDGGIYLSR